MSAIHKRRSSTISRSFKAAKIIRNCLPYPLRLAQTPEHPIADGIYLNRRPRKFRSDGWGHMHRAWHKLGNTDADDLDRALAAQGHGRTNRECGRDGGT